MGNGAEGLDLGFEVANCAILPGEDITTYKIPGRSIREADALRCRKHLLRDEQLRRLPVIAPDLIYSERNGLVLAAVLALDHQHRDTVDQEDDVLTIAKVTVVEIEFFGYFADVLGGINVVDDFKIKLAAVLGTEKLMLIAENVQKVTVSINVRVQPLELAHQRALGFLVFRVKGADLGMEQVSEEKRPLPCPLLGHCTDGVEPSPPLSFLARDKDPAYLLRIAQDAGLDGFMFGRTQFRRTPYKADQQPAPALVWLTNAKAASEITTLHTLAIVLHPNQYFLQHSNDHTQPRRAEHLGLFLAGTV